jgi:histone-lysine N-methyltransferase SETD2
LAASADLTPDQLIAEYVGEIIPSHTFAKRALDYEEAGIQHHYFMALNKNEYIDATMMGSIARFMNHSCNPNCLLQKWTVGNKTRMGMFTKRRIPKGQELTFDYRMERYGNKAQPCYCGESMCTGFIGGGSTASEEFDLEAYMAPKKISKSKRSVFKELEREEEGASQWKKGLQTREDVEGYCRFFLKNTEDLVRLPAFMHVLQVRLANYCDQSRKRPKNFEDGLVVCMVI